MSAPQSTIIISHVDGLDNTYKNTRHWDSLQQQVNYLTVTCRKATYTDYTYLRRSWSIKVNGTMEQADSQAWNYLSFRNSDNGKWFFYFITHYEYINDRCIELFLEMDVMQTYFWDMELLHSYVEREHTASDDVGENIIDEALECGELVVLEDYDINLDLCVLILSTFDLNESNSTTRVDAFGQSFDEVFSGLSVYAVKKADFGRLQTKLNNFETWGYIDGIISMWMYPQELVEPMSGDNSWDGTNVFHKVKGIKKGVEKEVDITRALNLIKTTTKQNKLLSSPYFLIYVTNNVGQSAVYKYEYFSAGQGVDKIRFELFGCLSAEGSLKIAPCNYKYLSVAYDEGIYAGNFPSCAWDSDVYKLWLAQNRNTVNFNSDMAQLKVVSGAITMGIGAIPFIDAGNAEGGFTTMISGFEQIAQQNAQMRDLQVQPPQARGNFGTSVNVANGRNAFTVQVKAVRVDYREKINDFFELYGYKVNKVKIPSTHNRKYFTFVKTIGCNVGGTVPHDCAVKIGGIFDTGVTFWRPDISVGDYSKARQNTPINGGD